jgi:PAS domain S-box-containing protein
MDANLLMDEERILDCNQAAVNLMKARSKEDLIGKHPAQISPEQQPDGKLSIDKAGEVIEAAFRDGSQRIEWQHRKLNGELFPVDIALTVIDIDQKPALYVVWRDLSARKQMEEALREREEQYRMLFNRTPAGIFHFDTDLCITQCNEGMAKMANISAERLIGFDLRQSKDLALLPALHSALEGKEGQYEGIYRPTFSPGELWAVFRTAPLFNQRGEVKGGVAILEDITQIKQAQLELSAAYEATLVGWSKVLDLGDHETEGHSTRVADLTLELASRMGIDESAQLHIRRGALLHDIGKLGVPDKILQKNGSLTEEEWVIMRRHPAAAYDMLVPIAYLSPALEIPFSHHEKWDGSGYPLGLQGEEIPLAARIFAVVDVWDALRSDRPYRAAWPESKALAYIQEQAGKHFDPQVVDAFLTLVEEQQGHLNPGS